MAFILLYLCFGFKTKNQNNHTIYLFFRLGFDTELS